MLRLVGNVQGLMVIHRCAIPGVFGVFGFFCQGFVEARVFNLKVSLSLSLSLALSLSLSLSLLCVCVGMCGGGGEGKVDMKFTLATNKNKETLWGNPAAHLEAGCQIR